MRLKTIRQKQAMATTILITVVQLILLPSSTISLSIGSRRRTYRSTALTSIATTANGSSRRNMNLFATKEDSTNKVLVSTQTKEDMNGKNVLLTGGSKGLGKALAFQYAYCNVKTLILSGRDVEGLDSVKEECLRILDDKDRNHDSKIHIVPCDLADPKSVNNLATQALKLCSNSKIDVLVNNGGISSRASFLDTSIDVDQLLMQVNFFSGVTLAKTIIPTMMTNNNNNNNNSDEKENGGGRLIWISSVQGKIGTPYRTSYAASKFAVQGYTEALRSELQSSNISVHVASPGYIRTNLSKSAMLGNGELYGKMDETTANGADPDEIAVEILDSVTRGKTDFIVAAGLSAKAAMFLKFFAPSFLEQMLVKRFEKQSKEK